MQAARSALWSQPYPPVTNNARTRHAARLALSCRDDVAALPAVAGLGRILDVPARDTVAEQIRVERGRPGPGEAKDRCRDKEWRSVARDPRRGLFK